MTRRPSIPLWSGLTKDEAAPDWSADSPAMHDIKSWRASERKQMIDAIADLIKMSHKYARSRYTRSSQRSKWTRLAGQLIWYKDQVLRAMTYEALEQDLHAMLRAIFQDGDPNKPLIAQPIVPIVRSHWTPVKTLPSAKDEDKEDKGIYEDKAGEGEPVAENTPEKPA